MAVLDLTKRKKRIEVAEDRPGFDAPQFAPAGIAASLLRGISAGPAQPAGQTIAQSVGLDPSQAQLDVAKTVAPGDDALSQSLVRRPSDRPRIAPATTKAQVDAQADTGTGPRIVREPGKTPLLTNVAGSREQIVGAGKRNFLRSEDTGKEFQLGDVESITPGDIGQGPRRDLVDRRGGVDRLEGKVIDVGGGEGGSLARFVSSRNKAIQESRAEAVLGERQTKLAEQKQAAELERQGKTFTVSPGEQVVGATGEVIARGGKKPAKEAKLLDDIALQFAQKDETGAPVLDIDGKPIVDTEAQGQFSRYLGKFGQGGDQRKAFTDFQQAIDKGVPENHLLQLKRNPELAENFQKKYGYIPNFVGAQ